ncbi:MAG: uroporphyrinogen-III C-methyltransferase [Omnitrophica bacterium]|nr:uroporphyrinogen-III C-methyltransferase [Candidatus Omnitrophota bacterium]
MKKVYLIGAGPGKSDLITVRGLNILKEADTIIYDYLVDNRILEQAKEKVELICCERINGKKNTAAHREEVINLLINKVKQGKKVIRLKNGDPSIFGRCSQELDLLLKKGIEFEVVPGVTAASAASCLSGIPLTDRRFASSCVFVTGHEDPTKKNSALDWEAIAKSGTIILYMAVGKLNSIVKKILQAGKDKNTSIAIIQNISLPRQKIIAGTLKDILTKVRNKKIKPPAIIIIGQVAKLEKQFNWLKRNKRILFTGLSRERYFIKGIYFHLPLIKIEPLKSYRQLDNYLKKIGAFDWIVFASRYGVEYFFARLRHIGLDSRMLNKIKIAAVGNSTAKRLLDFGILADLIPKKESAEGLIEKLKKENLKHKKIFLPRSNISDKGLSKALQNLGAEVTTGFAYRNVIPEGLPDLDLKFFDEIMFTSPSTVRNFKQRYKRIPRSVKVKCIGKVTLKEAKRCRLLN